MPMRKWAFVAAIVIIAAIVVFYWREKQPPQGSGQVYNIGVVSPLTGSFAFYGESTSAGARLAALELESEGIKVNIISEDGQTDPVKSLNAAQKLVNVDGARAIYSDLNPAAIAISSFLKGKDILHVYDAAPISPLEDNPLVFKTYIDFTAGCKEIALYLKNKGINTAGMLKPNFEAGELCLEGAREVFGEKLFVEEYNLGTSDFRTHIIKLRQHDIGALINISFPDETLSSLKNLRELRSNAVFAASSDSISPDTLSANQGLFEGVVAFGLAAPSDDFVQRLKNKLPQANISYYPSAALAYIHVKQMARSLASCQNADTECIKMKMNSSKPDDVIGFGGFDRRIAKFDMPIKVIRSGEFIGAE